MDFWNNRIIKKQTVREMDRPLRKQIWHEPFEKVKASNFKLQNTVKSKQQNSKAAILITEHFYLK